jgi:hypothetical protein
MTERTNLGSGWGQVNSPSLVGLVQQNRSVQSELLSTWGLTVRFRLDPYFQLVGF